MKEQIVQAWDDLFLAEENRKVPAEITVSFGFRGQNYEIDLTAMNSMEFDNLMQRYLSAATKVDSMGKVKKRPNDRKPNTYYEAMRKFADEHPDPNISYRIDGENRFFYPAALRRAYEDSLFGVMPRIP